MRPAAEDRIFSNIQIVDKTVIIVVNNLTERTQTLAPEIKVCNDDARKRTTVSGPTCHWSQPTSLGIADARQPASGAQSHVVTRAPGADAIRNGDVEEGRLAKEVDLLVGDHRGEPWLEEERHDLSRGSGENRRQRRQRSIFGGLRHRVGGLRHSYLASDRDEAVEWKSDLPPFGG